MLLESLLQHSRVGRVGAAAEDIDLAELVQEIADYIAPRPGFSVTYRGQIACIRTSKAPLEQVLRNLIGNGLKHHDREAGAVTISARISATLSNFGWRTTGRALRRLFTNASSRCSRPQIAR